MTALDQRIEHLSTAAAKLLRTRQDFDKLLVMEGTRVGKAVARIETALTRIERAAADMPQTPQADPRLVQRNEKLESTLQDGLAELDRLIRKLEQ